MKVRHIKGGKIIAGIDFGDAVEYTFTKAQLADEYTRKRINKALLEGRIKEVKELKDSETDAEKEALELERKALFARAAELGFNPSPKIGNEKLKALIADKEQGKV